jgi:zinc protease
MLVPVLILAACTSTRSVDAPQAPPARPAAAIMPADPNTTAAADLDAPLPINPKVRVGRLANGLTYYVRQNEKPADRAELRLVVDAGSVLEDDDQRGLAHFVEHMAFNGTTRFPKQDLIDYLELTGTRFGADLNAYTSLDETVYMLSVRTDSLAQLATGLEILREWATEIVFEREEVEKERGVVIEEWRLGRGAQARIFDRQLPVLMKGSKYAERLPIGDKETLETAERSTVVRFYKDWYRPGLMAIIVVGDVDADAMESSIQSLFSTIPAATDARERPTFGVPENDDPLFAIATDPEAPYSSVSVVFKLPEQDKNSLRAYRRSLVEQLYNGMFNQRLSELTQSSDPPFVAAGSGGGSFTRNPDFYNLFAIVKEGGIQRGLEVVLTEAERVRQFGFTSSELERQKQDLIRGYERAFSEREKTESGRLVGELVRHFLEDEPVPGIEFEYDVVQQVVPGIALEEVNALARQLITDRNRVVLADGPEKEGLEYPDETELMGLFKQVESATLAAYEDKVLDAPLMAEMPVAGAIVSEETNEDVGVTTLVLSNGITVILKPTTFKNDEILLAAESPGGTSLVNDDRHVPASYASTLIGRSGVGEFGPIELEKKLAGKVVSVSPFVSELTEGFRGSASPADLETLFQLVHLYVTNPRADSTSYLSYKQRIGSLLESFKADPAQAFRDTVQVTMAQYHPRRKPFSEETLEQMDLMASLDVYRDRFADAGDFTFYLVGAFELDAIKPLISKYLGSLPASGREEMWRDVGVRPPTGRVEKAVRRGIEPKSQVYLHFSGSHPWSNEDRRLISVVKDVLSTRLREVLREDLGGTYGVSVNASLQRRPDERFSFVINFGCDPGRVDELTDKVHAVIDTLVTVGTTDTYLQRSRETTMTAHRVGLEQNGSWMSWLQFYKENDLPVSDIPEGIVRFYDAVTVDDVKAAAGKFLGRENTVRVVLYPEDWGKQD